LLIGGTVSGLVNKDYENLRSKL